MTPGIGNLCLDQQISVFTVVHTEITFTDRSHSPACVWLTEGVNAEVFVYEFTISYKRACKFS